MIRDGSVRVASWDATVTNGGGGADCGGGPGVAMHPLWEKRAAASRIVQQAAATAGGIFDGPDAGVLLDGGSSAAQGGEEKALLSQPEAFYVNVYSRRFQREFPPASLGCRGGILADEMGMGKVRRGMRMSGSLLIAGFSRRRWCLMDTSCSVFPSWFLGPKSVFRSQRSPPEFLWPLASWTMVAR